MLGQARLWVDDEGGGPEVAYNYALKTFGQRFLLLYCKATNSLLSDIRHIQSSIAFKTASYDSPL